MDFRFSAGALRALQGVEETERLPIFWTGERDPLARWLRRHRPRCILTQSETLVADLRAAGHSVPDDIAVLHWNLDDKLQRQGLAGSDQNSALVGSHAVDLVVGQVHRHERSVEAKRRFFLVESRFVAGHTFRPCTPPETPPAWRRRLRAAPAGRRWRALDLSGFFGEGCVETLDAQQFFFTPAGDVRIFGLPFRVVSRVATPTRAIHLPRADRTLRVSLPLEGAPRVLAFLSACGYAGDALEIGLCRVQFRDGTSQSCRLRSWGHSAPAPRPGTIDLQDSWPGLPVLPASRTTLLRIRSGHEERCLYISLWSLEKPSKEAESLEITLLPEIPTALSILSVAVGE